MTAKYQVIVDGPIARVALANPPMNTLDVPFMLELATAFQGLSALPDNKRPRAIVLESAVAGQFSAGIDPRAVLGTDVYGRKKIFLALADLVEAIWFSGIPTVADVSGPALAGGAVLATLADFAAFDAEKGKICFSEVKVGLPLPLFVQKLIRNKTTPSCWNEVMIMGRNVDAADALRFGFANAVYKDKTEHEEAMKGLVGRIVRLPPAALTQTILAGRQPDRPLLAKFRADLAAFSGFLTDDYLGKGLAAVAKGESPKF